MTWSGTPGGSVAVSNRLYVMLNETHHGKTSGRPLPPAELIISTRRIMIQHEETIVTNLKP